MDPQTVVGQNNVQTRIYVLESETVQSLLNDFSKRSGEKISTLNSQEFSQYLNDLAILVSELTPSKVQKLDFENITPISKRIINSLSGYTQASDDFFNTLNLCIVGLGTKLREAIR